MTWIQKWESTSPADNQARSVHMVLSHISVLPNQQRDGLNLQGLRVEMLPSALCES